MSSDETVSDVAKKEATRQAIILVFSIAGTAAVWYFMQNPTFYKTNKMAIARWVKGYAQRRALWWLNIADRAERAYESERS